MFIPKLWFRLYAPVDLGAGGGSGSPPPAPTAAPSPTPASTPGGSPAPSPSATPSPTPAASGSPTTTTPTPADDFQDGDWRTMRTRYDSQKAEIATLKSQSGSYTKVHSQAQGMAKTLGYTDQDFTDAFSTDPVKTLSLLSQEMSERQSTTQAPSGQPSSQDLAAQIAAETQRQIAPINSIVNRQVTEAAMTRYNQTVDGLLTANPVLKDAPPEVTSIVKDYLGEYFSTQPSILLAMKEKGDFSMVPDAVTLVANRLHAAFRSWASKTQPPQPGGAPPANGLPSGNKKFSLDDFIERPEVLGDRYKA